MPWTRNDGGLKLVGGTHYDVNSIRRLIGQMRQSRKGQPETVCTSLEALLHNGGASRQLVWRFSKWCDWRDVRKGVALSIAEQLFHGVICRRLLDQRDRPIPNKAIAEADYQTWLDRVVLASEGLRSNPVFPDEIEQDESYFEGAVHRVWVNSYERNPEARAACLNHYGTKCWVCHFDFGTSYDGIGEGFIHVHLLRKLSDIRQLSEVDPIKDLRPVCPNCHAIIHLYREPFGIDEVKAMVSRARQRHVEPS